MRPAELLLAFVRFGQHRKKRDILALNILNKRSEEHTSELQTDRKSTRLNSSHRYISYAVFCLKKKNTSPYGYSIPIAVRYTQDAFSRSGCFFFQAEDGIRVVSVTGVRRVLFRSEFVWQGKKLQGAYIEWT